MLKKEYGNKVIGEVTVDQCIGGSRDVKCMYYETSLLDAQEGIRFRGYSIPELQAKLPTFKGPPGQGEPLPEAIIWLLLTSEIPSVEQTRMLTADLAARAKLPAHVEPLIRSLPKSMHPMTQLSMALLACQTDSKFAKAYQNGDTRDRDRSPFSYASFSYISFQICAFMMHLVSYPLSFLRYVPTYDPFPVCCTPLPFLPFLAPPIRILLSIYRLNIPHQIFFPQMFSYSNIGTLHHLNLNPTSNLISTLPEFSPLPFYFVRHPQIQILGIYLGGRFGRDCQATRDCRFDLPMFVRRR